MSNETILYRLEQAEKHIEETEAHIVELNKKFEEREIERHKQEKKNLIWGIIFLGSIVTSLGGILWNYRGVIFK